MDRYRLTVCRQKLRDYDIPHLERVMQKHLAISGHAFNRAFKCSENLSFDCKVSLDAVQLCLLELEELGFRVRVDRLPELLESIVTGESPPGAASITYDDCYVLLNNKASSLARVSKYKNWVVFACCVTVLSSYLVMFYSSLPQ